MRKPRIVEFNPAPHAAPPLAPSPSVVVAVGASPLVGFDPWSALDQACGWLANAYAVYAGAEPVPANRDELLKLIFDINSALMARLENMPKK